MEVRDSVFSSRANSQNCMAAKSVFPPRLERAVSDLALSSHRISEAESVSGTFAFYVKGRRASPPAEKLNQQTEAQPGELRPTSPIKTPRLQKDELTKSTSLPKPEGSQDKEDSPKLQVLLVEDNLVNRRCLSSFFNSFALTVA